MTASLDFYVVRNKEGKFFRAKGYGGHGDSWVEEIGRARVYANIRGPRGVVSFFALNYPDYGVPEIVRLHATEAEVIDETERIKKAKEKKQQKKEKEELLATQRKLKEAERDFHNAKARYEKLQSMK